MKIDYKYSLPNNFLDFEVVEVLDFREEPILLLESDSIGNMYLSYLVTSTADVEQRLYAQISERRLSEIKKEAMLVKEAFENAENKYVYVLNLSLERGETLQSYCIPTSEFVGLDLVPENYSISFTPKLRNDNFGNETIEKYAIESQSFLVDFYLQSKNLEKNIKHYAIYKVLLPFIDMIKSTIGFSSRIADNCLAFSGISHSSLKTTIEINYSHDFFREKETEAMETIYSLINAESKEDFDNVISGKKREKYIRDYTIIVKAIIENDARLETVFVNPITRTRSVSVLNKVKAEKVKRIIDEEFEVIVDIEEIDAIAYLRNVVRVDYEEKNPQRIQTKGRNLIDVVLCLNKEKKTIFTFK